MNIPAEVIDYIFNFLKSDPETLSACLESHPCLSQLAEPHMYSHIFLATPDGYPSSGRRFNPSDLAKLLYERPHIARYVHSLEIDVVGDPNAAHRLEEVSKFLPIFSALRKITLDHSSAISCLLWSKQPESFRLAFLACIRQPSMQDVYLTSVSGFPFISLLNDEYKSLQKLTLRGSCFRHYNKVQDASSHPKSRLPFKSLCLQNCDQVTLEGMVDWAVAGVLQPRSLRFSSNRYEYLSKLLTSYSTTLVKLYVDIDDGFVSYYDLKKNLLIVEGSTAHIPVILSDLPYLKELTIHSKLDYVCSKARWGFYSAVPAITQLFSDNHPSPLQLRYITLEFDCVYYPKIPKFPPHSSVSDVICIPLVRLLSTISAASSSYASVSYPSIQVDVFLDGIALAGKTTTSSRRAFLCFLLSSLRDCEELMRYLHY